MEMLMVRKAKSNLPVSIRNTLNDWDSIHQALLQRQATQAANYNSHAGPKLANLYIGQRGRVQDHWDGTWTVAKVIKKCDGPRSFVVETPNGSRIRPNRCHMRDIPEPSKLPPQLGPPPVARRVWFDHVPETPEPVPQVPSGPPQAKIQNSSGAQSAQKQDGYSSFGRKIKKTVRMDL